MFYGKTNFTYARIAGFMNAIKKAGAPINIYVIRSSGLGEYDAAHNCGEYNIYHLPDFSDFDAIILDINNFYNTNENLYGAKGASYVIRTAAASGKPVISLANKLADFYYVGIDNYAAMTSVIEYLHGELGLSDFAIQYKLPGCETIEEMCLALEPCIPAMQCRGLYLVLDKELYEYGNQISFDQDSGQAKSTNEGLMTEGYPESMELVFFWEEGIGMTFPKKTIQGLFPTFDSDKAGRDFLFAPIHFMDASVGYIVIRDCEEILHTGNIAPIVNTLTMAMRGFFAGKKLEYLNQMLSGISMRDSLTGLCNRLGYYHLASRLFRRVTSEGRRLGVIFLDENALCQTGKITCLLNLMERNSRRRSVYSKGQKN
ncbi:MAG: hypothetical protein J6O55_01970 [Lachnospiraceae bacterium]|nr:hypothetical protein [Lachnospiraceae bacterium]